MKNLNLLLNWVGREKSYKQARRSRGSLDSIVSRFCLASLICTLLLTVGVGNAWGATTTYTHDFTTTFANGDQTLSTITWTASSCTNVGAYNSANYKGVQFGTKKANGSFTLTSKYNWGAQTGTSYYGYTNVKKVYVWLNTGGGTTTASVTVGGTAATGDGTTVVKNSSATSQRDGTTKVTFTPAAGHNTGVIAITCNASGGAAGYICSIQVECEEPGGGGCTSISPTLNYSATMLTAGGSHATVTSVSGNTGNATPEYSVTSATPAGCITVNASTGEVTPVAAGTGTVTASFPAVSTYCSGTATKDFTVNAASSLYTITYDAGSGTCGTSTWAQTSAGQSTTLPTPVPECDGWSFAGWCTSSAGSSATNTSSPGTILTGEYTPASNITLHAVYTKTEGGGGSATLTKLGSSYEPTAGDNLVIVEPNGSYAIYQETSGTYVAYWDFSNNATTVGSDDKNYITLESDGNGGWYLGDATNGYLHNASSNNLIASTDSHTSFSIAWNSTGFNIVGNSRWLSCRTDVAYPNTNKYRMGGSTSGSASGDALFDLYKYVAGGGGTTYYMTNYACVVCDNKVNVIKGSETNGTFVLSQSGELPTCSGGRVITVTPTPAAHYRVASVTADNPATTGTATVTGPVNNVWTITYSENSKGNSTVSVSFVAIPTHTITLDPSEPANGTTSLESAGTTSVTLDEGIICSLWTVPDDCYSLSSITITPADGYSELEANGENKWEIIDITKDLSVAVVYAQRAQYTVTLDAGTGSVAGSTSITQSNCGNITLPAASPSDACAAEGWTFAGWSKTKVTSETSSAPVLYTGSYAPTATETLYAVYKQSSGAAVSYWVKVKDDSKLAAGDSVIIAASEYAEAMSTTQNSNNRGQASITKNASGDTLTAISASVEKFLLSAGSKSGTFSFYDSNRKGYLYAASSSYNYLRTQGSRDDNASWTIDITSATGVASIVAQGSNTRNTMQYNHTSSLFACYASASQDDLCLYTKAMGSTNTYFSSPSCTPCVSAAASLSSSAISMTTGKSSVITLTSANTSAVTATSSNTEVATVSVSGKNITVNGIAEGEATVIIQQVRDGVDESAHCEVYFEVSISVTTATIEIIEWEREAVTIEYDGDPEASVILGKEVEHGSKTGTVATELFFSKYFEAAGEDKLFGIYNGTGDAVDLTGYEVKVVFPSGIETIDLSAYGKTTGEIANKEELIFYRYGSTGYSEDCMKDLEGYSDWIQYDHNAMKFSGTQSIGLYKNGTLIDIIGATYSKAVGGHAKGDLVLLNKVSGSNGIAPSWGDESGFNAEGCGDDISTDDIETNYGLSTNRCLLVRKNTVTSGADAVASNKTDKNPDTNPADCAAAFQTLCSEWGGMHVPSWEDKTTATCNGMGYVAGFDYSDYYVTMETFSDDTEIGGYSNDDGTYTIPLPHLDTLACRLIRIQLAKEGNVIASSDPKVPIVVDADMSTNSEEFYKHSIDTCKECDVVIRNKATLTKAANGATKDRSELQNITVYSGSHLVIPSGATNFRAKSIVLRSLDDTVSTASFAGGVTFKDKGYRVYHSKRVKQDRWYWMSLPYACSTSKITWQDGTKATIGTDFHLKYYDGAQRAATQQGGCWKEYTGSTIQPGVGYILSVEQRVGHTYRELIFPMDTISEGETTKGVPVDDYGAGESITPNHKGWNLVGNPYMTYYQKNKINAGDKNLPALTVGKLIPHDSIDAENPLRTIHTYTIDVSGDNNAPFITVPKDHGNSEYEQKLVMDYDLPPFISYFVQIGNNTPVATQQYVNFAKADLTTTPSSLLPASYICRRAVEEEEVDPQEAVLVTLRMKNHEQEADETTFIISDQYSADYEIGSDLGKWFGDNYKDYTKPVLYSKANDGDKLVFYSLPDASAEQWIPLGFWGGNVTQPITFSLRRNNRKLDYVKSVMLHDKTQNTYTELLENDYQFAPGSQTKLNGSRFEVKVMLERPKNVPTGLENIHEGLYAYANGSQLVVVGLPEQASVWIYDAVGHLIASEATVNYMRTYTMPAQGVYFVRVNSAAGQQTLRTIVK